MSAIIGEKAKFLTLLDNQAAEELVPIYSIDIHLGRSPKNKVKCGSISVFKLNAVDLKMPEKYDYTKIDPKILDEIERASQKANQQTDMMCRDPIMFRETEGRWIQWAIDESLKIFDEVGGSAKISLKCPRLRIQMKRSSREVARLRSNPRDLFPLAWDIDRLLDGNFSYDPWNHKIRRGRIDALTSKR